MLGVEIYIYEINMHFKVNNTDKIRTMYKSEGYVLHSDCFSQEEYTYQIFMCTDTELNKN